MEIAGTSEGSAPLSEFGQRQSTRQTMFRKTGELANRSYDWSASVADIKAPTLLMFADVDTIRPEHVVEFYKL